MKTKNSYCRNCESKLTGAYCINCGQRASVYKVTLRETFQDFIDAVFSVDAPFFVTLKLLLIKPGKLFREYLDGKRKSYYKPVAFFILMSVVYLLVRALLNFDPFSETAFKIVDPTEDQLMAKAGRFMLTHIDKLLFTLVFMLGFLMKLFFFRKRTFAEFLAVSFYLLGGYMLFTLLNMLYITSVNSKIYFLHILAMYLYFIYAMVSFFPKRKLITIVKSLIIFPLGFFSYVALAYSFSYFITWLKHL